jgi:ligand-binding sensor domain-containing protein/putative methionine-R-sulfoxide reductase with GAF domain/HPt (histidine-containing phosphotransfer) domain-containing protein
MQRQIPQYPTKSSRFPKTQSGNSFPFLIQNLFWILVLLILIPPSEVFSSQLRFEKVNINEGLSQSTVTSIFQDKQGFLWFGTQDGLNRYDGYSFLVYRTNPSDPFAISDNWITCISEDSSGNLWIGTAGGGVNQFNKHTEKFTRYLAQPEISNSLSANRVRCLLVDSDNFIWIGTEGGGLNIYDPEQDAFVIYRAHATSWRGLSDNTVTSLVEDNQKQLWIGTTDRGLNRFDKTTGKFYHYRLDSDASSFMETDQIRALYLDSNHTLWIGTENGLYVYRNNQTTLQGLSPSDFIQTTVQVPVRFIREDRDKSLWVGTEQGIYRKALKDKRFHHHQHNPRNPQSLSENRVLSILEDASGIIWIGTNAGGLNKYDRKRNSFAHYKQDPLNVNSLSDNNIWAFFEDKNGMIWIGTNNGLTRFNPKNNSFRSYPVNPSVNGALGHPVVRAIQVDSQGFVWCGTDGGGLYRLDRKTNQFKVFRHETDNPNTISDDRIRALFEDENQVLWIGTWNGLNALDLEQNRLIHYTHDPGNPHSLSDNRIRSIYQDRRGYLWIGTYGGINVLDKQKGSFLSFKHNPEHINSLSNDRILCIHEDRSNRLWIGTFQGLNRFDRVEDSFHHFSTKDGLPNEVIYGIVEDEMGMLWLSTNNGLARYDPSRSHLENFRNFDVNDGLQSNEFNGGAYLKSQSGAIYFGGINGFNKFYAHDIKENENIPPVVITAFKKFDRPMVLPQSILATKEIRLNYRDNFFAFEFAALDFSNPQKNQYAYKLDGFDENWIECGNRRYASYTNLDGGEYLFRVRASNNDRVWNTKGASVRIIITPPFWKTWWFRIFAALCLLTIGYITYQSKVNRIEKQRQLLKQEVENRTTELISTNKRLVKAQKEAEKYSAQSRLLYEVGQRISQDLDLDTVLNNVVSNARDAFDYFGVMLFLFDKKRKGLLLKSIAGGYSDIFPKDMFLKIVEGMIGQAAQSQKTQLSNDVSQNKYYVRKAEEVTLSELSIPIVSGKELIGVLDVQSDRLNAFGSSDVDVMETFSTQIASAIKNARLYEQAQREIHDRRRAEEQLRESRDRLASAKKETDSIFQNIDEGLFLLNNKGEIGAQYSGSLEVILKQSDLKGKSLTAILENKLTEQILNSTAEYLKIIFDDSIDEDSLEALNPLSEVELNFCDAEGYFQENCFLMFRFKRIQNRRGITQNIMVSVRDISAQKRLAQQLEQRESEQKKQIEWMLSILHVEPSLLREFMDGAKNELEFISKLLRGNGTDTEYQTILHHAGRSMHLVKGNASLLDLKFFEKKAHQFEDKIHELQKISKLNGAHFIPLVLQLEDMRSTIKEIDKLIDRLGSIHNQFRPKREFESQMFIKSLQNLVQNLAKDYEKEVLFDHSEFEPGLIPYEFRLTMKEMLVQLIRNAVYHGIEKTPERIKMNKNPHGILHLKTTRQNGKLQLHLRDDGRGLQLDLLRRKAKELQRWDVAEIDHWSDKQLADLIFVPGISTADKTDLIAGRGLGMELVKERIERINGQIYLKSAENQYCEFVIEIPLENNGKTIKDKKQANYARDHSLNPA